MTIYYAHPMALYGSALEADDIARIETHLGSCLNPNTPPFKEAVARIKAAGGKPMAPFVEAVQGSAGLAWRAFPDGTIGAGVRLEIDIALAAGKPVYRLPDMAPVAPHPRDTLSIADTQAANRRWTAADWTIDTQTV
jgi:hypothetical protein